MLFLDELGEASAIIQTRLLRVIQSGEYLSVGSSEARVAKFHVVAATNRSEAELRQGVGIRTDLFYRPRRQLGMCTSDN